MVRQQSTPSYIFNLLTSDVGLSALYGFSYTFESLMDINDYKPLLSYKLF